LTNDYFWASHPLSVDLSKVERGTYDVVVSEKFDTPAMAPIRYEAAALEWDVLAVPKDGWELSSENYVDQVAIIIIISVYSSLKIIFTMLSRGSHRLAKEQLDAMLVNIQEEYGLKVEDPEGQQRKAKAFGLLTIFLILAATMGGAD
jgi:hypothetical protein